MLKNISANWVLTLLRILSAYLLMPFTLAMLGKDGYGLWILVTSITGYLGILILGTPMASVRHMAKEIADKNDAGLNQVFATFGGLYLLLGVVSALIGLVLLLLFPMGFDVAAPDVSTARLAMLLVLIHISASFFQQLPYGLMASYHDFVARNLIMGSGILLKIIITYVLLALIPNVYTVAVIQLLVIAFEFIVSWLVISRRYPHVSFSLSNFRRDRLKSIFSFSLYVMLLHLAGQLSFQTDSMVIGGYLTVADIPFYAVANSLTIYFMEFVIAVAAVVMPMSTKLQSEGDIKGLQEIFLKWSKICLSLSLLGGAYLLVFGPRFLAWWIGDEFEGPSGSVLRILMFSFLWFLPIRGVAQPMLMGLGKPGLPTITFFLISLINIVISILLAPHYGLDGIAWGTAIPNIMFAVALVLITCKHTQLPVSQFVDYVVIRPTLGFLPVVAVGYWMLVQFDFSSTLGLGFAGVVTCAMFAIISQVYVYSNDRFVKLNLLKRLKL